MCNFSKPLAQVFIERSKSCVIMDGEALEQPVNFGKRLAHTDKIVREKGFVVLKKWLKKHPDLTRLDFMKLWKGLYFAVWMADKRPVQQELAVNIALLLNDVPKEKQAMWIDTFWETMVTAWEKLDIHRITKYLQLIRIVIAESFKVMRVSGWPEDDLRALGETFTQAAPMKAKGSHNAHSLALLLQFTRIFWEELRPQLEAASSTPKQAILALLEPFCVIAETSSQESLVRHVHENIFRKAPRELFTSLMSRMLASAAKPETTQKNRQALYDTADALERVAASPAPKDVKPVSLRDDSDSSAIKSSLPPLELPPSAKAKSPLAKAEEKAPDQQTSKKKGRKRKASKSGADKKASTNSGMSPLMLPDAMLPAEEATKTTSQAKAVASDINPKKRKGKKKKNTKL